MGEKRIDELNDALYPSYYHYLPIDRDVAAETAKLKTDYFGRANDSSNTRCLGNTNTTGAIIPSGKYFYKYDAYHSNRALAKAISNIAVNATLTENTNFKYVTIGEELDALNDALKDVTDSKNLGTSVDLTLYTASNQYTAPHDGYVKCEAAYVTSNTAILYVNDVNMVDIGGNGNHGQAVLIYVKKGMKLRGLVAGSATVVYIPLSI